jgi:hypothetical protein
VLNAKKNDDAEMREEKRDEQRGAMKPWGECFFFFFFFLKKNLHGKKKKKKKKITPIARKATEKK